MMDKITYSKDIINHFWFDKILDHIGDNAAYEYFG